MAERERRQGAQADRPMEILEEWTFQRFPKTAEADPTDDYHVANKQYVDAASGGDITKIVILEAHATSDTDDIPQALGNFPVQALLSNEARLAVWRVGSDFSSLTNVYAIMIPDTTETIQADLYVSVAANGETHNADDRTLVDQTKAVTVNVVTEWDIKLGTLFDNIAIGDYVGIRLVSNTSYIKLVGFVIVYVGTGGAGGVGDHAIGGASHTADTLAALNSKVSDATLDDSGDSRPPSGAASGELGGTYPSPTVDATHSGSAHHPQLHESAHEVGGGDELVDGATAPADVAAAAASGTATKPPRMDHVHKHPALASGDLHPEYQTPAEHTAVGDAAPHHAKYLDSEAVAAIESEDPLDLAGDVSVAKGLNIPMLSSPTNSKGASWLRLFYQGVVGKAVKVIDSAGTQKYLLDDVTSYTITGNWAFNEAVKLKGVASPGTPDANHIYLFGDTTGEEVQFTDDLGNTRTLEHTSRKGVASGYAGLDGSGNVNQPPQAHGDSRHTGTIGYVERQIVLPLIPTNSGAYQLNDLSTPVPILSTPKTNSAAVVYVMSEDNFTGTVTVYCEAEDGTAQWNEDIVLAGVKYGKETGKTYDIDQYDRLYAKVTAFTSGGEKLTATVLFKEPVTAT